MNNTIIDTKIVCIALIIIVLIETFLLVYLYSKTMSDEKVMNSIFQGNEVIQISDDPIVYITRRDKNKEIFIRFMENKGYKLEEQYGAMYCFEKEGKKTFYDQKYTRYFIEWTKQKDKTNK